MAYSDIKISRVLKHLGVHIDTVSGIYDDQGDDIQSRGATSLAWPDHFFFFFIWSHFMKSQITLLF